MKTKYLVGVVLVAGVLVAGAPAMAKGNFFSDIKDALSRKEHPVVSILPVPSRSGSPEVRKTPSAGNVACVGTAVATREASLATAVDAQTSAIKNAYSTRAKALSDAYAKTVLSDVRLGVKGAWLQFDTAMKAAGKAWKESQRTAWAKFKTDEKACKDISGTTDAVNMGHEMSGM